jgi:hypothetical protein
MALSGHFFVKINLKESKEMTNSTNKQNEDFTAKPHKDDIFQLYVAWRSLPAHLKGLRGAVLREGLCIEDEATLELLHIKTQTQFSERYDVSTFTLSQWNKIIDQRDLLADSREFGKKLVSNVLFAMYKNAMSFNPNSYKDRLNFIRVVFGKRAFEDRGVESKVNGLMDLLRDKIEARQKIQLT